MNFTLRPWNTKDIDSLVKYANNINIAKFMTDKFPNPYTKENGEAFIAFATKDDPIHIFAIDVNGEAVGGIGLHPKEDIERMNAELGYWLAEPFWGNGIITKAIAQIVDFGFKFECKFEKTLMKNGEMLDELYYSIRRNEK